MAEHTPNLGLLKKDPLADGNETFNIETMLNDNWDKIDEAVGQVREELENVDVDIPNASLTEKGIVQLSNATNGTREDVAATEKAVKAAYDEALAGKQLGVEQKANVVAALNSIGVAASTSETWAQLVAKMAGVIRATGNATAADVLSGRTASNASGPFTGTMPNRGAVSQTITTQNGSYTVPAGYHNGSGVIRAAFANLTADNIRAGVNVGGVVGDLKPSVSGSQYVNDHQTFDLYGSQTVRRTFYSIPSPDINCLTIINLASNFSFGAGVTTQMSIRLSTSPETPFLTVSTTTLSIRSIALDFKNGVYAVVYTQAGNANFQLQRGSLPALTGGEELVVYMTSGSYTYGSINANFYASWG